MTPGSGRIAWHRPRFYRYEVSLAAPLRVQLNRYPGAVIGAYIVVGQWAYCVKWGWAR